MQPAQSMIGPINTSGAFYTLPQKAPCLKLIPRLANKLSITAVDKHPATVVPRATSAITASNGSRETTSNEPSTSYQRPQKRMDAPRTRKSRALDPRLAQLTRDLIAAPSIGSMKKVIVKENITIDDFRTLLTYLDRQDALHVARNAFRAFRQLGIPGGEDAVIWTKLISMHSKRPGGALHAIHIYDEMAIGGVRPDLVTYNVTLTAAGRGRQWTKLKKVLGDMKAAGVRPDEFTFSSIFSACQINNKWKEALNWFEEMVNIWGLKPNVVHYTSVITVLQRAGQWQKSMEMFEKMEQAGIEPDVMSYNAAIAASSKGGDWEKAWAIFIALKRAGIQPTTVSYNAVISACERGGEPDRALEIFAAMKRSGTRPNTVTFNTLISACGKSGRYDDALTLYAEMQEAGIACDVFTLTGLITACERQGKWEKAVEFFKTFSTQHGIAPNVVAYNQLISTLGGCGQSQLAYAAFDAMRMRGLKPDIVTYGALISALNQGGQWREALDVLDILREARLTPNQYMLESLLSACEQGARWETASQLFKEMQELDIPLDNLNMMARRAFYAFPSLLSVMPAPLVQAARVTIDSGRAAREWLKRGSSSSSSKKASRTTTDITF